VTVVPDLPPAPWRWGQVTPEQSRRDLQPKPRGVAPVPTDGTWVVSIDAAAQALDQHWRAQTVFRPDKTGLVCERSVRSAFCDH
jgi:hypothetical protein